MENVIIEPKHFFMNENVSILEVKRTDLDPSTSKEKIYQWLKIEDGEIETLSFPRKKIENINGNDIHVREFSNSELRFDDDFAKFQEEQGGQLLAKIKTQDIPVEIIFSVSNFLIH